MLTNSLLPHSRERGTTILEVMITLIILAFGLIGLAGLQSKIQLASIESYQRAQAIVLMSDMEQRMQIDRNHADDFVISTDTGTGALADCSGLTGAAKDKCEWGNTLKGAGETKGSTTNVGAMTGARGCITKVQDADATSGVCRPAIYQISVAWQGLHEISSKVNENNDCGKDSYGANDNYRRVISTRVAVPLLSCS